MSFSGNNNNESVVVVVDEPASVPVSVLATGKVPWRKSYLLSFSIKVVLGQKPSKPSPRRVGINPDSPFLFAGIGIFMQNRTSVLFYKFTA